MWPLFSEWEPTLATSKFSVQSTGWSKIEQCEQCKFGLTCATGSLSWRTEISDDPSYQNCSTKSKGRLDLRSSTETEIVLYRVKTRLVLGLGSKPFLPDSYSKVQNPSQNESARVAKTHFMCQISHQATLSWQAILAIESNLPGLNKSTKLCWFFYQVVELFFEY